MNQKNKPKSLPPMQSPYKKQLKQIAKMAHYEPIASIPSQNNQFNYTYARDGTLKKKAKKQLQQPVPSIHRLDSILKRLPKIDRKDEKVSKFQYHPTNASEQYLTLDTKHSDQSMLMNSYIQSKLSQSPKNSDVTKEYYKPSRRNQRYKLSPKKSQQSDSQYEEYQDNATPGPGEYSISDKMYLSGIKRGLTDFSFGSRASRFTEMKKEPERKVKKNKNPESCQKQKSNKKVVRPKKLIPFLSGSLKYNENLSPQKIPGPQDYISRTGIQQQLIKKIQRNFKGSFGSSQQRFKIDKMDNLGPGSYTQDATEQSNIIGSYYFISNKNRFQ